MMLKEVVEQLEVVQMLREVELPVLHLLLVLQVMPKGLGDHLEMHP